MPIPWSMEPYQHQPSQQQLTGQVYDTKYPSNSFARERSSSNRNLPDTAKLRGQPRRASDEVAGSSSQRLMARISPAPSRRSISVMNVGDNFTRSSSKLGSASNLIKQAQMRRDSIQHQQQQQQQAYPPVSATAKYPQQSDHESPSRSPRKNVDSTGGSPQYGITPSGRRSSLVGIQSMTGYRSQKNSHSATSDTSDHSRSPVKSGTSSSASLAQKRSQPVTPQQSNLVSGAGESKVQRAQQHRGSIVSVSPSQGGSRRGSNEQFPVQLQRKGSFAMLTLRKLKRTMSLTKGNDKDQPGSNQDSRQSSFSSGESSTELAEDLGITRRIVAHTGM